MIFIEYQFHIALKYCRFELLEYFYRYNFHFTWISNPYIFDISIYIRK